MYPVSSATNFSYTSFATGWMSECEIKRSCTTTGDTVDNDWIDFKFVQKGSHKVSSFWWSRSTLDWGSSVARSWRCNNTKACLDQIIEDVWIAIMHTWSTMKAENIWSVSFRVDLDCTLLRHDNIRWTFSFLFDLVYKGTFLAAANYARNYTAEKAASSNRNDSDYKPQLHPFLIYFI